MKVHRVLLCSGAAPPSIAIKEVHRFLYFSLFIELVKFGSQCSAIIIISFKKDMEILKMMTTTLKAHKKAKVNTHLKALHLAKKCNHPKRKRSI